MAEALSLGVDHWDVAEIYGRGLSETVIGRYLAQTRAEVSIATKAGIYNEPERHFRNDAGALRCSLEGSLSRLGRDRVELFYIHRREAARPVEEVMETLVGFIEEGLIGAIGLSGGRACDLAPGPRGASRRRRAIGIFTVVAAAGDGHAAGLRGAWHDLSSRSRPSGVASSPTAFPTARRFRPASSARRTPRFTEPKTIPPTRPPSRRFCDWCRARAGRPQAVAVAWTLHRGDHVLPIPGTRSAAHIRELAQAAEIILTQRRSCRDRNDPALGPSPIARAIPTPSGRAWNSTARRGESSRVTDPQSCRSKSHHLLDSGRIALAGVQAFGQVRAQFMMV